MFRVRTRITSALDPVTCVVGRRHACNDARHGGQLLPGDVRIRLRRVAPRRLLPGGPQEGRHARLLLVAAVVGGDQLHVPPVPHREDPRDVARARAPRVRLHAEGEPAHHALRRLEGLRRRRARLPRAREDAGRPAGLRALPVPAEPALRPRADRGLRRVPPPDREREPAVRDGVPPRIVARGPGSAAGPRRRVVRGPDRREGPDAREISWDPAGYFRLRKTEYTDDELTAWAERIGTALAGGADVFCYFKHEDEGASPQMAKRLEAILSPPPRPIARERPPTVSRRGH